MIKIVPKYRVDDLALGGARGGVLRFRADPEEAPTLLWQAMKGETGPKGDKGEAGGLDDAVVLDGGNF